MAITEQEMKDFAKASQTDLFLESNEPLASPLSPAQVSHAEFDADSDKDGLPKAYSVTSERTEQKIDEKLYASLEATEDSLLAGLTMRLPVIDGRDQLVSRLTQQIEHAKTQNLVEQLRTAYALGEELFESLFSQPEDVKSTDMFLKAAVLKQLDHAWLLDGWMMIANNKRSAIRAMLTQRFAESAPGDGDSTLEEVLQELDTLYNKSTAAKQDFFLASIIVMPTHFFETVVGYEDFPEDSSALELMKDEYVAKQPDHPFIPYCLDNKVKLVKSRMGLQPSDDGYDSAHYFIDVCWAIKSEQYWEPSLSKEIADFFEYLIGQDAADIIWDFVYFASITLQISLPLYIKRLLYQILGTPAYSYLSDVDKNVLSCLTQTLFIVDLPIDWSRIFITSAYRNRSMGTMSYVIDVALPLLVQRFPERGLPLFITSAYRNSRSMGTMSYVIDVALPLLMQRFPERGLPQLFQIFEHILNDGHSLLLDNAIDVLKLFMQHLPAACQSEDGRAYLTSFLPEPVVGPPTEDDLIRAVQVKIISITANFLDRYFMEDYRKAFKNLLEVLSVQRAMPITELLTVALNSQFQMFDDEAMRNLITDLFELANNKLQPKQFAEHLLNAVLGQLLSWLKTGKSALAPSLLNTLFQHKTFIDLVKSDLRVLYRFCDFLDEVKKYHDQQLVNVVDNAAQDVSSTTPTVFIKGCKFGYRVPLTLAAITTHLLTKSNQASTLLAERMMNKLTPLLSVEYLESAKNYKTLPMAKAAPGKRKKRYTNLTIHVLAGIVARSNPANSTSASSDSSGTPSPASGDEKHAASHGKGVKVA